MKTKNRVSYQNDVFFKYALASDDEKSKYIRHTIIEKLTGIHPVSSKVLNPGILPKHIDDKMMVLDVHLKDDKGNLYDIEMQSYGSSQSEYRRFLMYGAQSITRQLKRGQDYELLKPVYQIIFIDAFAFNNDNLVNTYVFKNQEGMVESDKPLITRIFIHLPAINHIAKHKTIEEMDEFELLCYLFKNEGNSAILKSKKGLVKTIMEKYLEMQEDEQLFTYAEQHTMIQWGIDYQKMEKYEEGMEKGKKQGKKEATIHLLSQLISKKYDEDASTWLSTLSDEQLSNVSDNLLEAESYEALVDKIN